MQGRRRRLPSAKNRPKAKRGCRRPLQRYRSHRPPPVKNRPKAERAGRRPLQRHCSRGSWPVEGGGGGARTPLQRHRNHRPPSVKNRPKAQRQGRRPLQRRQRPRPQALQSRATRKALQAVKKLLLRRHRPPIRAPRRSPLPRQRSPLKDQGANSLGSLCCSSSWGQVPGRFIGGGSMPMLCHPISPRQTGAWK